VTTYRWVQRFGPEFGTTNRPDSAWVTQQPRNLSITGGLEDKHILLRDRDSKFSGPFDEVARTEGLTVVKTPVRAPRANAFAERWVGSVRRECLDHVLIFGWRHPQRVLGAYTDHYNLARPHRSLQLRPPEPGSDPEAMPRAKIRHRDVLGGLIHEYRRSAA
jgi:transposase InsO family protein